MKRLLALGLAAAMALSLTACGGRSDPAASAGMSAAEGSAHPAPEMSAPTAPLPEVSEPVEPIPEVSEPVEPTPDVSEPVQQTTDPALLEGVWLEIGSEVEGDVAQSMPGRFASLIIEPDGAQGMTASSEIWGYVGFVEEQSFYNSPLTMLEQPLYHGCGNDVWSARIGALSPLNENGYPKNTEHYITLLDENTLLYQRYFSFDGGPGVSYALCKRFLPAPCRQVTPQQLEGGDFVCTGFFPPEGPELTLPDGMEEFYLHLDPNGAFFFTVSYPAGESFSGEGNWIFGEGGTLLMQGDNFPYDWFAGAARMVNNSPELYLWYEGGIMYLEHVAGSGGEGAL